MAPLAASRAWAEFTVILAGRSTPDALHAHDILRSTPAAKSHRGNQFSDHQPRPATVADAVHGVVQQGRAADRAGYLLGCLAPFWRARPRGCGDIEILERARLLRSRAQGRHAPDRL